MTKRKISAFREAARRWARALAMPVAAPPAAFAAVLLAAHLILCLVYLAPGHFITFRGVNGFVILEWAWDWLQRPVPVLEGIGFPLLPVLSNALFLKLFGGDVMNAYRVCELTVSSAGVLLFFAVCLRLELPVWLAFLTALASLPHYEHLTNSVVTHFHDNFFGAAALLAAWGWLGYRRSGRPGGLYAAAAGALLGSMSRWEGFVFPMILSFLLAAVRPWRGRGEAKAAWHAGAAALLSWAYVLATAVRLYVKRIGLGPLKLQKTIYADHFAAGLMSPLQIFNEQLFWHPKNAWILALAAAAFLALLLRAGPDRERFRRWTEFLLFPAGILLAYLAFTALRFGTPKTHLWPGVLMSLPALFLWLRPRAGAAARAAALAGAAGLLAALLAALPPQLSIDQHPLPAQILRAGRAMQAFWRDGLLAPDAKVLVEVWRGGRVGEDRGKTQLGALTIFKSPGQVVFDRYGPSLYRFPGDRIERIDPAEDWFFALDDGALRRRLAEQRIGMVLAHSPEVSRRLAREMTPFLRVGELTFWRRREASRRAFRPLGPGDAALFH